MYRAFERDGVHNNEWVKQEGKNDVRCLALWGDQSFADEKTALDMCAEYYNKSEYETVKDSGHWIGFP